VNSILYSEVMLTPEPQAYATAIRRKNYLRVLREVAPKGAFLEIGPGNGEMLTVAKEAGFPSMDIADIDAGVVERIRAWHPEVSAHYVEVGTPLSAVLGAKRFACIVACHVFEHIPQDQRLTVLKECHAMLIPGGALVLELPNPLCPLGGWANYLADPTHQLPMSSSGLCKLMFLAGFSSVNAGSVRPVVSLIRLMGVLRWTLSVGIGWLANALGRSSDVRAPAYYVIARRI
jgi:SAM-dependent methyltransferase